MSESAVAVAPALEPAETEIRFLRDALEHAQSALTREVSRNTRMIRLLKRMEAGDYGVHLIPFAKEALFYADV